MNKFTKGEWTNFDFRYSPDLYQNGHFQIVGNNQTENVAIIPAHWGSAQANAHLIAAAPDMYEALKFFIERNVSEYQYLDRGIGTATDVGKSFLAARKALAKVEGK